MCKIVEVSELLTFQEVKILLQSLGYDSITGIRMPEEQLTREAVIKLLHQMSEKGLLRAKGERFIMDSRIGEMMVCMGQPDKTVFYDSGDSWFPSYFCYMKEEQVLVSELYPVKKDVLKLTLFNREEYEKWKEQMPDDIRRCGSADSGEDL